MAAYEKEPPAQRPFQRIANSAHARRPVGGMAVDPARLFANPPQRFDPPSARAPHKVPARWGWGRICVWRVCANGHQKAAWTCEYTHRPSGYSISSLSIDDTVNVFIESVVLHEGGGCLYHREGVSPLRGGGVFGGVCVHNCLVHYARTT